MKDIKEAIQASIATDSIIHVTVNAADIYEAMEGVGYDDAIEVDGAYDVWGTDEDDNTWRILVNIQSPAKTYMKTEFDFGREYADFLGSNSTVNINDMVTSSSDIPDDDYRAMVEFGIENPNALEYWRGFNSYSTEKTYMNPETGSIDTYEGWYYTTEDREQVNAVDLGEVVEIVKDNDGQWREI